MIQGKRVLALVPARSGSKGLPRKNIRPLGGKPLLAWPIQAALASKFVDEVVLSTDSEEFAEIGRAYGARVPFLRPEPLANDCAPSIGFVLHALDTLEQCGERFDYLVLLEPTSPLTESEDIDQALVKLDEAQMSADAVVGVTTMETVHPAFAVKMAENGSISPYLNAGFCNLPRRQDLEPVYSMDGSLYISSVEALRRERSFCHQRTLGFLMPRYKSFEVDDLVDFICIDAIWRNLEAIRGASPKQDTEAEANNHA